MPTTDLSLRPAVLEDAPAMADLHVACRAANVPSMPPMVHDRATTHRWMADRLARGSVGWVAEQHGTLVGYLVLTGDWLDDLFLAPGRTGQGIGEALLDVAKASRPDGFCLWVFASNTGARRFYERHGLVALETTDGRSNEERAPDVRMAWPGADPLRCYRRLIDEVDEHLGELLARRVALTRVAQTVKPLSRRDPGREQEITARLAALAPELGEDRAGRIVHTIITESLAAAGVVENPQNGNNRSTRDLR